LAQQTKEDYIQKNVNKSNLQQQQNANKDRFCCSLLAQNKSMHSNPETQPTKALSFESNSDPDLKVCHASM